MNLLNITIYQKEEFMEEEVNVKEISVEKICDVVANVFSRTPIKGVLEKWIEKVKNPFLRSLLVALNENVRDGVKAIIELSHILDKIIKITYNVGMFKGEIYVRIIKETG